MINSEGMIKASRILIDLEKVTEYVGEAKVIHLQFISNRIADMIGNLEREKALLNAVNYA